MTATQVVIILSCPSCGSTNVSCDAKAKWNVLTAEWEYAGELDNRCCDDCGAETSSLDVKEIPLEEHIARQIDPETWQSIDAVEETPGRTATYLRKRAEASIYAAQRLIEAGMTF